MIIGPMAALPLMISHCEKTLLSTNLTKVQIKHRALTTAACYIAGPLIGINEGDSDSKMIYKWHRPMSGD